ncbi:MAG: hypothetical protein ACYC9M_06600, partial [Desulfobulbaceae bacterium]
MKLTAWLMERVQRSLFPHLNKCMPTPLTAQEERCCLSHYLTQFFLIVLIRFSDCFADRCGQHEARRDG